MKNELKFYTSLSLFTLTTCLIWGISLSLVYIFIITFDASNFWWWLSIALIYGISISLPIIIYPRTMSRIHMNNIGIKKIIFRKSKGNFIKWVDIRDVQVLTRPNGYSYILISSSSIKCKSFEEVLKTKNIIYFTYNDKDYGNISGVENLMVRMEDTFDSHVINGVFEGDYSERTVNGWLSKCNGEQSACFMSYGGEFNSLDNITITQVAGYNSSVNQNGSYGWGNRRI